jgi:hypothetical protein
MATPKLVPPKLIATTLPAAQEMKAIDAFDITPHLTAVKPGYEHLYHYKFNPSICHYRGKIFIGVYRCVINKTVPKDSTVHQHETEAIWKTNWKTIVFDGIGVFKLKLNPSGTVAVLSDMIVQDRVIDARIFRAPKGWATRFAVSYNPPSGPLVTGRRVRDLAVPILVAPLITSDESKVRGAPALANPTTLPCLEAYGKDLIQKNWGFFCRGDRLLAVQWVCPLTVVSVENGDGACSKVVADTTILDRIQSANPGNIFFSSSTPLIPFPGGGYLGVGHVKYKYKNLEILPTRAIVNDIKTHGAYVYLNFFYLITHNKGWHLSAVSKCFHIPSLGRYKYALNFPNGLTRFGSNILMSYGDGDISCNIMTMPVSRVKSLLVPMATVEREGVVFQYGGHQKVVVA